MQFELSGELIDEIIFCMEDQDGDFLLDTRDGIVVNTELDVLDDDTDDTDDRYISLPDWEPSDGFRLMERFTAGLHNALVREELSSALDRGRGVFRAFKNTLSRYPETEKLWRRYKDREMKRELIAWYNSLRESWGLELIGDEPEDISGLVLEDFRFRAGTINDTAAAEELHRICLSEFYQKMSNSFGSKFSTKFSLHDTQFDTKFSSLFAHNEWSFPGDICFIAESAAGDFAGFINAVYEDIGREESRALCICAIEVLPEYRGLGLSKALMTRLVEQADSEKIHHIILNLPYGQEHFARVLLRENFNPCVQRYVRTLHE